MLGLCKMRLCVLLALLSVVISTPARPLGPKENHPEDMQMLDEEDMKQLLTDLFISSSRDARQLELDDDADDGEDGDAADVADVTDDADNTLDYKAAVDSDSKGSEEEVARFNNYIDAIYRRMNAALRAKMMDPMTLNLDDKQKKKSNKPRSLGKREADDEDEDVEEFDEKDDTPEVLAEDEMEHRAGKAEKKGKGRKGSGAAARKNKKNKKGKKEDKEDKATKKAEREAAKKEKQEKKMKKQELREKKRAEKKKEKAGASRRQSRSGQKNKNKKKQSNKKNKKSRNTNNKNKKTKNTNNKNKRNNNNKGRSGNARNNVKDEKMMGSLSGIATLRREGDVVVKEEETHKIITSEFNVGPLQLEVSKMYGKGQARTVKSAKAITEVMSGTMTLKVKPDGSAHVKKVVFKEPENVDVKGSLSDNKPRNLRYLKNSVNKMRPLAAIRVLKTARYVLKSPNSSVN